MAFFKTGDELKGAADSAEKLLDERGRIKTAIATANVNAYEAEAECKSSLSGLAEIEAQNAMLTADQQVDPRAAHKRLMSARNNLEGLRARITGLEAKLSTNRVALTEAQTRIERLRAEVGGKQLAEHREKILGAVAALRKEMQRGLAADWAVNGVNGGFRLWLADTQFSHPENFGINLLSTAVQDADASLPALDHAAIVQRLRSELSEALAA